MKRKDRMASLSVICLKIGWVGDKWYTIWRRKIWSVELFYNPRTADAPNFSLKFESQQIYLKILKNSVMSVINMYYPKIILALKHSWVKIQFNMHLIILKTWVYQLFKVQKKKNISLAYPHTRDSIYRTLMCLTFFLNIFQKSMKYLTWQRCLWLVKIWNKTLNYLGI